MEHGALAKLISPIHGILQRISASEISQVGIFPERLTLLFEVTREREAKFVGAIKRILAVEEAFEHGSPLCMFVSRSVMLSPSGELELSEWLVQFQVNHSAGYDPKIVEKQAEAILFELESYLFD